MSKKSLGIVLLLVTVFTTVSHGCGDGGGEKTVQPGGITGETITFQGELKWKFEVVTKGDVSQAATDSRSVFFSNSDSGGSASTLQALNQESGEILWELKKNTSSLSPPAVGGSVIYCGDKDGHLFAVDAGTGQEKWSFLAGGGIYAAPVPSGGSVYVSSADRNIYAIDALSGQEIWNFETGEMLTPAGGGSGSSNVTFYTGPAVDGDSVYFGGAAISGAGGRPVEADSNLYAVDARTGQEKWRFSTKEGVSSTPVIADGTVYIGSWDNTVYGVDAATGQEKWRFSVPEDETHGFPILYPRPAVAGDAVLIESMAEKKNLGSSYIGDRSFNTIYALDARSGKERWHYDADKKLGDGAWGSSLPPLHRSPAAAGGLVYFGSVDGNLYAVNAATGAGAGRFTTGDQINNTPVIADGVIFFASGDHYFYAVSS